MSTPPLKIQELLFFVICLALGGLAELSFFHAPVGISYLVFTTGFYLVFFLRYRRFPFRQRRMGILMMFVILVLSANYVLYDAFIFQLLNALLLPTLMLAHLVLLTKPSYIHWYRGTFLIRMITTFFGAFAFNAYFLQRLYKRIFKQMDEKNSEVMRKVLLGLLIGAPLLFVVVGLLMQADAAFQNFLSVFPDWLNGLEVNEVFIRVLIALALGWLFFGVMQILPREETKTPAEPKQGETYDGIVSLTILILLNVVYALFTAVQFTYFFGGELYEGMSYAEYARRGFFELVVVSLVNLTVLVIMLKINRPDAKKLDRTLRSMYSLLIVFSGILLVSAFQRLMLYEAEYGYTMARVLPHVFMIFLIVIFAYTGIRVWIDRLPLIHFYLITAVLFYTGLNAVNVEAWIVDRNIDRYEETGKLDIDYLNSLGYTGVDGLIEIYQEYPEYKNLERKLEERKEEWTNQERAWQSFNIPRYEVVKKLDDLEL
ncbi:DUF4173 domain-containing protein [Halobacillus litoralis]|uniref:DUF4153 domain-containing protein n=1 Tax=Halobacillus litoralis TaxID=45668 RepID=UPI001CD61122|nr:DUF4173 domain-containing protein [Halobacillus litoralis]MCA0972580.1 DUF4173 domain-containing protein [Halobacillus litoralis]